MFLFITWIFTVDWGHFHYHMFLQTKCFFFEWKITIQFIIAYVCPQTWIFWIARFCLAFGLNEGGEGGIKLMFTTRLSFDPLQHLYNLMFETWCSQIVVLVLMFKIWCNVHVVLYCILYCIGQYDHSCIHGLVNTSTPGGGGGQCGGRG